MVVIGVGNPDRGDDAVGWRVVDLVGDRVPAHRSGGDPASLIEAWSGYEHVVLVDATSTDRPPGTITRRDDPSLTRPPMPSSHGLGPAEAIELARALDRLPPKLTVIGIEGASFEHGAGLTPPVAAAAEAVAALLAVLSHRPRA
jgi:hydrogenase maturation protease